MTETAFFEALVWGAYLVGLVAVAHMIFEGLGWALRNWPATGPKVGE